MQSTAKKGAPRGNRNAAVGDQDLDGVLQVKCLRTEKGIWTAAARQNKCRNLSQWVRQTLNAAAKNRPPEGGTTGT